MAAFLLSSLIFLSFFTVSPPPVIPSETVSDAVEILSDSGYVSMSLTLQLISQSPMFQSSAAATIFAPSDEVFKKSGQPTIVLLQYHLSPLKFSLQNLISLPYGTKIPTLYPNQSLIVTSSSGSDISLNNVRINGSVIFDVGSLIVFGIHELFDPCFQVSAAILPPAPRSDPSSDVVIGDDSPLATASASSLIFRGGYSAMASFLDMQFLGGLSEVKVYLVMGVGTGTLVSLLGLLLFIFLKRFCLKKTEQTSDVENVAEINSHGEEEEEEDVAEEEEEEEESHGEEDVAEEEEEVESHEASDDERKILGRPLLSPLSRQKKKLNLFR